MDFSAAFKRERRYIWLVTALLVLGGAYLFTSGLYVQQGLLYLILIGAALLGVALLLTRCHWKKGPVPLDPDARPERYEALFDRYARRSVNWLLVAFWRVGSFVLGLVTLAVNSKADEVMETVIGNQLTLEILVFFLIKNLLILRWLNGRRTFEKQPAFRREVRWVLIASGIYWALSGTLFYVFERVFVLDSSPFLSGLFAALVLLYNFTRINRFTYEKKRHNKVVLATVLAVVLVAGGYAFLSRDIWLTQPYINATPYIYEGESGIAYDDKTGVYTITKAEGDFKILQLTDIHLGGGVLSYDKDLKALKAVYALLTETKPDLVVVTGDLTFPVGLSSFSFNNTAPVQQFAAFMRNTGVPWAFTYGNHDTESYAATSAHDLNTLYKSLSYKTSRTLLYPYIQPDIWGRNNQLIELRNADGTLNQGLFLIDSNAYTGEGLNKYDFIHDDQVAWYRENVLRMNVEAGRIVPSLGFFHIPLQEYKTAYELYEQGSDEVTWYFGANEEKMMDKVCCSKYPSSLFDVAKELGSTTGFFCGHDHYNNMSLEYEGIRLTYGMSIDYLVMPGIARDTKQRGGTLITVHEDGTTDIVQVPLTAVIQETK